MPFEKPYVEYIRPGSIGPYGEVFRCTETAAPECDTRIDPATMMPGTLKRVVFPVVRKMGGDKPREYVPF